MSKYDNMTRYEFGIEQCKNYPERSTFIHDTAIVYPWVKYGKNFRAHEYVTIGTQGWGIFRDKNRDKWTHIPHIGGVVIGDDVEIHGHTNVDRGTVNDTVIGNGVKIDEHCHIGHNSKIGNNTAISACTIIGGSSVIGDNVWIGPNSSILNKVKVANNTYIGQGSNVVSDIEEEGMLVYGNPAKAYERDELPHNKIG